jgi:hypothetical protein
MDEGVLGTSDAGSASHAEPLTGTAGPHEGVLEPTDRTPLVRDVDARLEDAAATGKTVELVVVLRGTVHRRRGQPRPLWSVRLPDGRYRVVSAEAVVAATPVKKKRTP